MKERLSPFYSERQKEVVIARSVATCLHAEVPRFGTQAWQSPGIASLRSQ
jgi:hypothetical protein